ncbi:phosphoserine phosphatase SerB [Helicobacter sp. MIT 03-1614]|jgi:phosphoserine phosphatase|uniref:phosphoserine phosphatase SerB n=1 Tax=Helicobacter TaxID=209 RepID=UPI0002F2AC4A|nr:MULTISPECIES: phosphoserine phosphatase SerB [Helicobacter]TLD89956.1 phosphoserine phosphatase SerB [Helicobacter sp. MIT 03-1614]
MKLVVFDFDSTLMDGETIDILAKAHNVSDEVAKITHKAMNGELDFYEALKSRVALLKGLSLQKTKEIAHNLPLMNGALPCVKALKAQNYKVVCFSGGFHIATDYFVDILGLDASFANILHHKDSILTGEVGGEMMFSDSKGIMLQRLQNLLSLTRKDTIVIGDGANDLSMFAYADVRIAFCAKEILKKEANILIETQDLREIPKALNIPFKE